MGIPFHIHESSVEPRGFIISNQSEPVCLIVDPGTNLDWCMQIIQSHQLRAVGILLTSGNLKVAARVAEISAALSCPVYCHTDALLELQRLPKEARESGLCGVKIPKIHTFVRDSECLTLEGFEVAVLESPSTNIPKKIAYRIGDNVFVGQNIDAMKSLLCSNQRVFPASGKPFHFDELFGENNEMK